MWADVEVVDGVVGLWGHAAVCAMSAAADSALLHFPLRFLRRRQFVTVLCLWLHLRWAKWIVGGGLPSCLRSVASYRPLMVVCVCGVVKWGKG